MRPCGRHCSPVPGSGQANCRGRSDSGHGASAAGRARRAGRGAGRARRPARVNAHVKVPCLVAGMIGGTCSIDARTCCGRGPWMCCSAGSGHCPCWARTCAPIPGGTSARCRRRTAGYWRNWAAAPRSCLAMTSWRSSCCRNGSTGTKSRVPGSGTPSSRA
jgi:hypothetical protein